MPDYTVIDEPERASEGKHWWVAPGGLPTDSPPPSGTTCVDSAQDKSDVRDKEMKVEHLLPIIKEELAKRGMFELPTSGPKNENAFYYNRLRVLSSVPSGK